MRCPSCSLDLPNWAIGCPKCRTEFYEDRVAPSFPTGPALTKVKEEGLGCGWISLFYVALPLIGARLLGPEGGGAGLLFGAVAHFLASKNSDGIRWYQAIFQSAARMLLLVAIGMMGLAFLQALPASCSSSFDPEREYRAR